MRSMGFAVLTVFSAAWLVGCDKQDDLAAADGDGSSPDGDGSSQVIEGFIGFVPATTLAMAWADDSVMFLASPEEYTCDDVAPWFRFPDEQYQSSSMKFSASILAPGAPSDWVGDYDLGGSTERWGEERFAAADVSEWDCDEGMIGEMCVNTTQWHAGDGTLSVTAVSGDVVSLEMTALGYFYDAEVDEFVEDLEVTAQLEATLCDFAVPSSTYSP